METTSVRTGIRWLPLVMLVALGAVWGGNPSFSKGLQAEGLSPAAVVFWQTGLAGCILLAICAVRGTRVPLDRKALLYYFAIGGIGIDIAYMNMVFVIGHLTAGLVSVINLMAPVLTYTIAIAIGMERIALLRAVGIALGFSGAAILVVPSGSLPSPDALPWALLAILTPAAYAFANIFAERGRPAGADNVALAAGTMLAAAAGAGTIALAGGSFHPIWRDIGDAEMLLAGYALATATGFLLFYAIIGRAGAVYLGQVGNIVTLFGVTWGVIFLGESTTIWLWLSVAVVGVGVALVNFGKPKAVPAATPRASDEIAGKGTA